MLPVRLTANFEANLGAIEHYWQAADTAHAYVQLLNTVGDTIIADLSQFPEIGRQYLSQNQQSVEAIKLLSQITKKFPLDNLLDNLREYLLNDYLILYININSIIYLLAIRHQRQHAFQYSKKINLI